MKGNRNKQKGYRYEKLLLDYFQSIGLHDSCRVVLHQGYDQGDIHIGNNIVIQAKDCTNLSIRKWIDEVHIQAKNASRLYPILSVKNRQKNITDSFIIMKLNTFTNLLLNPIYEQYRHI